MHAPLSPVPMVDFPELHSHLRNADLDERAKQPRTQIKYATLKGIALIAVRAMAIVSMTSGSTPCWAWTPRVAPARRNGG